MYRISIREIIPFVVAAIGGFGGMVGALAHMRMIDALNSLRASGEQIPNPPTSGDEFRWFWKNPGFDYWSVLRKYRIEFPDGKLRFWLTAGTIWAISWFAVAVVLFVVLQ
jgi:hypothetical protein